MYYDSENVLALRNRGMSYRQAKSYTASIADYVRANSMEPDYEDWVQSARERRQELALDRGGGASEFAPSMNEEEMAGSSFLYKQLLQDEQVSVRREQSSLTERSSSKTSSEDTAKKRFALSALTIFFFFFLPCILIAIF